MVYCKAWCPDYFPRHVSQDEFEAEIDLLTDANACLYVDNFKIKQGGRLRRIFEAVRAFFGWTDRRDPVLIESVALKLYRFGLGQGYAHEGDLSNTCLKKYDDHNLYRSICQFQSENTPNLGFFARRFSRQCALPAWAGETHFKEASGRHSLLKFEQAYNQLEREIPKELYDRVTEWVSSERLNSERVCLFLRKFAKKAFDHGQISEMETYFQECNARFPEDAYLKAFYFLALVQNERFDEAKRFKKAVLAFADELKNGAFKGFLYACLGRFVRQREFIERATQCWEECSIERYREDVEKTVQNWSVEFVKDARQQLRLIQLQKELIQHREYRMKQIVRFYQRKVEDWKGEFPSNFSIHTASSEFQGGLDLT